jgi:hypothetical protein
VSFFTFLFQFSISNFGLFDCLVCGAHPC